MPSINLSCTPLGPLITVLVGLSVPHLAVLKQLGHTPPAYRQGQFLVDTGASCTCVDPALVQPLGLTPSGAVMMQTPSTNGVAVACNQYDASLFIPDGQAGFLIEAIPVLESGLSAQGIDGLIGRDVIDRCTLIYNGSAGMFTLAY